MMPRRTKVGKGVSTTQGTEDDLLIRMPDHYTDITQAVAHRRAAAEKVMHQEGYNAGGPENNWTPSPEGRELTDYAKSMRKLGAALSQLLPSVLWSPRNVPIRVAAATGVIRHGVELLGHRSQGLHEVALLDALLLGEAWVRMNMAELLPKFKAARKAVRDSARKKAVKRHGGEAGLLNRQDRDGVIEKMFAFLREKHPTWSVSKCAEAISPHLADGGWFGRNGALLSVRAILDIHKRNREVPTN